MTFTPKTEAGWAAMASYAKTAKKAGKRQIWMRKFDALAPDKLAHLFGRGHRGSLYWDLASYYFSIGLTPEAAIDRAETKAEKESTYKRGGV